MRGPDLVHNVRVTSIDAIPPHARRVQFFTGKGGVGKTSVVVGLGLALAKRGKRALIVELGHRASIASVLGGEDIGDTPVEISPGLSAVNLGLEATLVEYITTHLKVRALAKAAVRNAALKRFFEAAPAVAEVAALHSIERFAEAKKRGAPRWDAVLVDLDATGHALMFFELPAVFEDIARDGPLRTLLDGFSSWMRDPAKVALHLVTLPLALPARETRELYDALSTRGHVALGGLIVNRVPEPPLSDETATALGAEPDDAPGAADRALALRAQAAWERADAAAWSLERELGLHTARLPELGAAQPDIAALTRLGEALLDSGGEA